jgi:hypothetical protein
MHMSGNLWLYYSWEKCPQSGIKNVVNNRYFEEGAGEKGRISGNAFDAKGCSVKDALWHWCDEFVGFCDGDVWLAGVS